MYALVTAGQIASVGPLPNAARRLVDGRWVTPPDARWTDGQAAECGYLPVTDTARPADTAATTWERAITLVAGVPTVTWTERGKTAGELAADETTANRSTIEGKAAAALGVNDTFLALASPTNAQVLAQTKMLTRECSALIRLLLQ